MWGVVLLLYTQQCRSKQQRIETRTIISSEGLLSPYLHKRSLLHRMLDKSFVRIFDRLSDEAVGGSFL